MSEGFFIKSKSQKCSITFLPKPSILKASFETKCLSFSLAMKLQLYPFVHLLTASSFFVFLLSFTTHAFGKSNEYYQSVITNIITNCKTDRCRKEIFEQEVHIAFFNLLDAILNQMQFEISQKKKEKLWSNEL